MNVKLYIMLFCCSLPVQSLCASEKQDVESDVASRAQLQRKNSIEFYQKNRCIKQAVILKKLKPDFDAHQPNIPIVFAKRVNEDAHDYEL